MIGSYRYRNKAVDQIDDIFELWALSIDDGFSI